jgi:bifunctional N-acetylglucosamine-1-phosphate-uridyltransferase/glucosamine-1-phosphate-acetyltransferase GlmU-like protein
MTNYQVVILAAGQHSFLDSNLAESKVAATLDSHGLTLLEACIEEFQNASKIVCAVNSEDFNFASKIGTKFRNVKLKTVHRPTAGALMSLALCLGDLDPDIPILVTSVDGLIPARATEFLENMKAASVIGGAMTIHSKSPLLSYVIKAGEKPIEFVEKQVVSEVATTGLFYFSDRELIRESVEWVLISKVSLDNKYYISSALNRLIFSNKPVGLFEVPSAEYLRFSTPEEFLTSRPLYERIRSGQVQD